MGKGIYSAVSGALSSMQHLEVVANNLANVSTAGYKGERVAFAEVLGRRLGASPSSENSFVAASASHTDLRQGPLSRTDRPLDVALEGTGYLAVRQGQGVAYTRGGSLAVNPQGELVLGASGARLLDIRRRVLRVDGDGPPPTIGRDGTVRQGKRVVGRLQLVEFARPQDLSRLGSSLYEAPKSAGAAVATRTGIRAGFIEKPNINMIRSVTSMISASRNYEAFHRLISTFRQVDSAAARIASER